MPWVRFMADFDWKPKPAVTVAYRAGQVKLVTTPCAEAAKTAGKAVSAKKGDADARGR